MMRYHLDREDNPPFQLWSIMRQVRPDHFSNPKLSSRQAALCTELDSKWQSEVGPVSYNEIDPTGDNKDIFIRESGEDNTSKL